MAVVATTTVPRKSNVPIILSFILGSIALLIAIVALILVFTYGKEGPRGATGPAGPTGPTGPAGPTLFQNIRTVTISNSTTSLDFVPNGLVILEPRGSPSTRLEVVPLIGQPSNTYMMVRNNLDQSITLTANQRIDNQCHLLQQGDRVWVSYANNRITFI